MKNRSFMLLFCAFVLSTFISSCSKENEYLYTTTTSGKDINSAPKVAIDRFSSTAGHLMVRTATNGLPAANAPINFDAAPFITTGLNENGAPITYYNFDVQSTKPGNVYFFYDADGNYMFNQNYIFSTIPGNSDYSDFWLINYVTVPSNYIPNSFTQEGEILASGYQIKKSKFLANYPIVPYGSTAARSIDSGKASVLTLGWFKGQAVSFFKFQEGHLAPTSSGEVPVSPIYVMFNDNAAGPSSGFKTEASNPNQTHNVLGSIPTDSDYSPLWSVNVIDNANFNTVINLTTAQSVPSTPAGVNVNCPVVK